MKNIRFALFLSFILAISPSLSRAQIITTIAGSGPVNITGYNGENILATDAVLGTPTGIAIDVEGNIYFAESGNNRIRKLSTAGIITTVAGNGAAGYSGDGGPATDAALNNPFGLAIDNAGNLYVAEINNGCIRKITPAGIITTIAGQPILSDRGDGGPATAAGFRWPMHLAFDHAGNLYITDNGDGRVRMINPAGIISTFIEVGSPTGITIDTHDNVYVLAHYAIVKTTPAGVTTTIAGTHMPGNLNFYDPGDGGPATAAVIDGEGLYIDPAGNLYICSSDIGLLRKISPDGYIHTIAGGGLTSYTALSIGDGGDAVYCYMDPLAIAADAAGNLIISDYGTNRIRRISYTTAVKNMPEEGHDISVYPTNNHGSFTVDLTSLTAAQAAITIMDVSGKKIQELNTATNKPIQLSLQVSAGTYFVVANTGTGRFYSKILVD